MCSMFYSRQKPTTMEVVVGTNLLDAGGDRYPVEKVIAHPKYSSQKIVNDIALLKLKDKITFGPFVKPIDLPTENTAGEEELMLSGWGSTTVSVFL